MEITIVHPRDRVQDFNVFETALQQEKTFQPGGYRGEFSTFEPELLALASTFKQGGHQVTYLDENLGDSFTMPSGDLLIAGGVTCQAEALQAIGQQCKQAKIPFVCVGPYATLNSETALKFSQLVVKGNPLQAAEIILMNWQNGGVVEATGILDYLTDFTLLKGRKPAIYPLVASRGCKNHCQFCTVAAGGHTPFVRSSYRLAEELYQLKKYDPQAAVVFTDDNLFSQPADWLEQFITVMEESALRYASHGDIGGAAQPELLEKLHLSGLQRIFIGGESFNPEILHKMMPQKSEFAVNFGEKIDIFQRAGIATLVSFILGFDGDDQAVEKIRDFAFSHHPAALTLSLYTPMPGTTCYQTMSKAGRITENRLSRYTQFWPVIAFQADEQNLIKEGTKLLRDFHSSEKRKIRIRHQLDLRS